MALYPSFNSSDLSGFSGRPNAVYLSDYSDSALAQATLLFRLASGLKDWPDDPDAAQLARFAVLAIADAFILSQPYQETLASPFQSETIGSYSYSKALRAMQAGMPTGVFWFDLAIQRLGISTDIARVISESYSLFERDLHQEVTPDGVRRILGPSEINPVDVPFSISIPVAFDPNKG